MKETLLNAGGDTSVGEVLFDVLWAPMEVLGTSVVWTTWVFDDIEVTSLTEDVSSACNVESWVTVWVVLGVEVLRLETSSDDVIVTGLIEGCSLVGWTINEIFANSTFWFAPSILKVTSLQKEGSCIIFQNLDKQKTTQYLCNFDFNWN